MVINQTKEFEIATTNNPIPVEEWKWFGNAGHFICSRWYRFHLCTQVGDYLISTVGEYVHPRHGRGSEVEESKWLSKHPLGEQVGCDRLFETMVFKAGKPCTAKSCGCGMPAVIGHELNCLGANDRKTATANHYELCHKYAAKQHSKKP